MADWRDVGPLIEALTEEKADAEAEKATAMNKRTPDIMTAAIRTAEIRLYERVLGKLRKLTPALASAPLWTATLYGDPRTKKNSMRIVGGKAKCPRCGKPVKQWLVQSAQHDSFSREASKQITPPPRPIDRPVSCRYVFYTQTRRKVDGLNLEATIDDLLVRCHVLTDDNSRIVIDHDGSRVCYDPDNPRVEITIFPSDEGDPQLALELD